MIDPRCLITERSAELAGDPSELGWPLCDDVGPRIQPLWLQADPRNLVWWEFW